MTKREFLGKALISPVFLVLYGAFTSVAIGLVIKELLGGKSPSFILMCGIILIWLSFIFLISLMLHRLKDITKGIEKVFKEGSDSRILLKNIEKGIDNKEGGDFGILESDEVSQLAAIKMREVKKIKVIGTARQDALDRFHDKYASDYLKSTEERLKSKETIIYQRITVTNLRPFFYNHLLELLKLSNGSNHLVQISFIENQFPPISYQIFDDERALIFVDNVIAHETIDYGVVISTSNETVIKALEKHFNDSWDLLKSKKCSTVEEFKAVAKKISYKQSNQKESISGVDSQPAT